MDIWSKSKRSDVMRRIGSKNTKPEKTVRSILFKKGFRFRIHRGDLPGKPDIVLSKYKTVIFVNGCFWHLHKGCNRGRIPSSNSEFWEEKLMRNVVRDEKNKNECANLGWNVLVVWECIIEKKLESLIEDLAKKIKSNTRPIS